jgi:hypothetical protein
MAEVESKIGKPVDVLSTPAGDAVWQYPSGSFGQQTYIVTFGTDGRVKSTSQALTWEKFATIQRGMSRDEIRLMFGRPFASVTYRRLDEEVWSYRYLIPVNDNRIFNVHLTQDGITEDDERSTRPPVPSNQPVRWAAISGETSCAGRRVSTSNLRG